MGIKYAVPIEEQPLVWAAMALTMLRYYGDTEANKLKRPQEMYEPGDGNTIWEFITVIKRQFYPDRLNAKGGGEKANLQQIKAKVLQTALDRGVSPAKRNFYSSAIATYFSWKHHGKKGNELLELLAHLPPLPPNCFQDKKGGPYHVQP